MRSVKLTLDGEYWDSQIYSGELILFGFDGGMHRIDWRQIIDAIASRDSPIQTAVRVAFSDSDLFYNPKVRKILCDPALEHPIKSQLDQLADVDLSASRAEWSQYWKEESSPFDFLTTDIDIYYNKIFAAGDEGLYSSPRGVPNSSQYLIKKQASKHHDGSLMQIRASDRFTAVAAAGGSDGLFEFEFLRADDSVLKEPRLLANRACSACDWAFQSVIGWTTDSAFLANFTQQTDPHSKKQIRSFDRIVETEEIFEGSRSLASKTAFTWGSREKIYRLTDDGVEVTNYAPAKKKNGKQKAAVPNRESFSPQGQTGKLNQQLFESPIATGTAPFGTILEYDDKLVILRSDGISETYPGEPVHWRVFPRSEHYSNQLHIIYEDRLLIVSFVHDYFVDQTSKLYGFSRGPNERKSDEELQY